MTDTLTYNHDGTTLTVKTAFGTATLELDKESNAANEALRSDDTQWPEDFTERQQWAILIGDVITGFAEFRTELRDQ